ncbi:MAG TPA: hypothetical protein V6C57_01770 [Coleofasciculaceae cyanobacterium]
MKTHAQQWLFEAPFHQHSQYLGINSILESENEWLFENPSSGLASPPLIKTETPPLQRTLYVNIPLGGESPAKPMTGIFIPAGYRLQASIDLILYLRGHHKGTPRQTIQEYWNARRFPYWAFREGVNNSGKNVILVAPTLGPASQAGRLLKPSGLDNYLNQVLAALKAYGPYSDRSPDIGNIILACHSGGGYPMRQLATSPQQYTTRIRECWGFDCLYNTGDEQIWTKWAQQRPGAKLYIHYGNGGTAQKSENLRRIARNLPNIEVQGSTRLAHDRVPITHWRDRILAAPFLNMN